MLNKNTQVRHILTAPSASLSLPLSRDIDRVGPVLVGCPLQRCWDCQRKYTVLAWNPGVLRQSVKFGHYSCNGAFMFPSQGSCVQQPRRGLFRRAARQRRRQRLSRGSHECQAERLQTLPQTWTVRQRDGDKKKDDKMNIKAFAGQNHLHMHFICACGAHVHATTVQSGARRPDTVRGGATIVTAFWCR